MVLIVALVVVWLLGWFPCVGGGTLEAQSKSYWAGAQPFAVTAYKVSGMSVEMNVKNMLTEQLTLTAVSFSGSSLSVTSTTFNGGE